jgi:SWI/SNF-related matrix-associated actin-dependent regulator 1 of chromatin subfamily A
MRVTVLEGRYNGRWPEENEIVILNYDITEGGFGRTSCGPSCAGKRCDSCQGTKTILPPAPLGVTLIADEAHYLKNPDAQRTAHTRQLVRVVRAAQGKVWGLTGTPLLNRPPELWGVLQSLSLAQEAFASYKNFAYLFDAKKGKFGTTWGRPKQPEVKERLDRVMIRRLKTQVLPDLPTKTWQIYEATPNAHDRRLLDKESGAYAAWLASPGETDLPSFSELSSARALLAAAKIPAMLDVVKAHEESETPLLVWSAYRAPIDALQDRDGWRVITGDTSPAWIVESVDLFQAGKLRGLGLTIQAGGTALTLTHASNALFVDRRWTPAENVQAEDRIVRIGQKNACLITDLVLDHPLDKRLHEVLMAKQSLIAATLQEAI